MPGRFATHSWPCSSGSTSLTSSRRAVLGRGGGESNPLMQGVIDSTMQASLVKFACIVAVVALALRTRFPSESRGRSVRSTSGTPRRRVESGRRSAPLAYRGFDQRGGAITMGAPVPAPFRRCSRAHARPEVEPPETAPASGQDPAIPRAIPRPCARARLRIGVAVPATAVAASPRHGFPQVDGDGFRRPAFEDPRHARRRCALPPRAHHAAEHQRGLGQTPGPGRPADRPRVEHRRGHDPAVVPRQRRALHQHVGRRVGPVRQRGDHAADRAHAVLPPSAVAPADRQVVAPRSVGGRRPRRQSRSRLALDQGRARRHRRRDARRRARAAL